MNALDDLDLRILAILQQDAAIANQALAEQVFTSPATAMRREHLLGQRLIGDGRVLLKDGEDS